MRSARSLPVRPWLKVGLVLVALSALISVRAAEQPGRDADPRGSLKSSVEARYDVVPLAQGIALVGRAQDRRVEIAGGVVLSEGIPLSGAELRRRFGGDADLVLRLSYLSDDELRTLFTRQPPPPPPAPPATPAPPVRSAPPARPALPADSGAEPAQGTPPAVSTTPVFRRTGARIALAKPIVVAADEEVRDGIFSLGGDVRVEGRVRDDIVVVAGRLELTSTADVRGDITLVGSELVSAPGARHAGAVHHAAGGNWPRWSWPGFTWSWFDMGGSARWLSLAGTLSRVALLAVAVIGLALLAGGRLMRIGDVASTSPIRAGLTGLAAQVLFIPALVLIAIVMAVTIVGLPFIALVVPLAVLTMFAAMLLGFAGLAQRLGAALGARLGWSASAAMGAALLGLAAIVLPTVLSRLVGVAPEFLRPVSWSLLALGTAVEYVAWTVGLGAAVLTGLGRWAVVPPPVPPPMSAPAEAPSVL